MWWGEIALQGAFVAFGCSTLAILVGLVSQHRGLRQLGVYSAAAGFAMLTTTLVVTIHAFVTKNFELACVRQYVSLKLPWYYSLSALWVGQSGSLLLWTWFTAALANCFYFGTFRRRKRLAHLTVRKATLSTATPPDKALPALTLGLMMAFCSFLMTIMVFSANPMESSVLPGNEGAGLSAVLQHPAMLIHPPIVFLGYACWTVSCALTMASLLRGRIDEWGTLSRPWSLLGWGSLGGGILVGGYWAYHELGWGGFWSWDPVENGSLLLWLLGTVHLHSLMAFRRAGVMKKVAVATCLSTFALCNFAAFLTRSGIFSSLHAFSTSPIGWYFLWFLSFFALSGIWLIVHRRKELAPARQITTFWCRESMVMMTAVTISLLAAHVLVGTLSPTLANWLFGKKIVLGVGFYNGALIPATLVVLAATAMAPLLRWRSAPGKKQARGLVWCLIVCGGVAMVFPQWESHSWIMSALVCLATFSGTASALCVYSDLRRRSVARKISWWDFMRGRRVLYAGFVIHAGLFLFALGLAMSSLGNRRAEVSLRPGESITLWDHYVRLSRLDQSRVDGKYVVTAELQGAHPRRGVFELRPSQELHDTPREWTTEVSIASTWDGDFYSILEGRGEDNFVNLTFIYNPGVSFVWWGGGTMAGGVLVVLWPRRPVQGRATRSLPNECFSHPDVVRKVWRKVAVMSVFACLLASEFLMIS